MSITIRHWRRESSAWDRDRLAAWLQHNLLVGREAARAIAADVEAELEARGEVAIGASELIALSARVAGARLGG